MNTLVFGEIIGAMEAFLANFTSKFLLTFVLTRMSKPIVFTYESFAACVACESNVKEKGREKVKRKSIIFKGVCNLRFNGSMCIHVRCIVGLAHKRTWTYVALEWL